MIWIIIVVNIGWLNPLPMLFGAVLPDADHRKSPVGRFIPLWIWFKHRGFTHTLWCLLLVSALFGLWDYRWAISYAIGHFIHLMLDSCTPMGVKWLQIRNQRKNPTSKRG